jgi:hypothetical protein
MSVQIQILNPKLNSIEQDWNRFLIIFEQFHVQHVIKIVGAASSFFIFILVWFNILHGLWIMKLGLMYTS